MTRAFIYKRVSTQEQANSRLGLQSQEQLCRDMARRLGMTIEGLCADEGVSASIPLAERSDGRRLTEMIAAGAVDVVIGLDQERLFRDTIDCLATLRRWHELGVRLILVDGGEIGVDDPDGFLTVAIRAVVGEHSRLQARQRTRRALAAAKADGRHVGGMPIGFRTGATYDGSGKKSNGGVLVPIEGEQAIIRRIRDLSRTCSAAEIARRFNAEGVPSKRGGVWKHQQVLSVLRRA